MPWHQLAAADALDFWWRSSLGTIVLTGCVAGLLAMALSKWLSGGVCHSHTRIDGKTVVITGGNTGIGKETAKELAHRGGRIIIACRDMTKGQAAAKEIEAATGSQVHLQHLDLSSFTSIKTCADRILETEAEVNILINNAGIMMCPYSETKEGFEMQFGTNHLGHFLFTHLLLDRIKSSAPARIINVSSVAHTAGKMHWNDLNMKTNYNARAAYCQSKLANILFTRELANKLKGTSVTCYAVHPGVVNTEIGRHLSDLNRLLGWSFKHIGRIVFKTAGQGAQTTVYCAVDETLDLKSGLYYSDCAEKMPTSLARNDLAAKKLWDISMDLVQPYLKNDSQTGVN